MKTLLTIALLFVTTPLWSHGVVPTTVQFYSFANETVPTYDHFVDKKVKHSIKNYRYCSIGSYILQKKAAKIFPVIEPILNQYGIPDDFKYMLLVESGFGDGVSSAGAAGPWQLMPSTARLLGLKVRKGSDERYNLHKSTVAACKYLRDLHREFKDWSLVAAAYNNGDNKIKRALLKQNQLSYFFLKLNPETGSYVYKIIAIKEILEKPSIYGYTKYLIPSVNKTPTFQLTPGA